jgi:carboxyl-terminal processing protease
LRYNGGGYVATAEYLDNWIVPTAKSGTLMYNTFYNTTLASGKEVLLAHQVRSGSPNYNYSQFDYSVAGNAVKFTKKGALNAGRVFFIVTGSTASASELTINNLRPEMSVQLIGQTTYGKPVGFFDIDINKYQMYIPEFSTQNSANQGDYYAGMTPGSATYPGLADYDDVTKDFGDPTEGLLAHALHYVKLGTYTVDNPATQNPGLGIRGFSLSGAHDMSLNLQDPHAFNGMIIKKVKMR